MKKEIQSVCAECGIAANVLTSLKKYGSPPKKLAFDCSTFHTGPCDVCEKQKSITQVRDFFFPDFGLLIKAMKKHEKH